MLDAAFRQIAGAVSAAVGGPYHAARLTYPGNPVYDDGGSIVTPGTQLQVDCRVQVDVATEAMRADAGFMAEDVRLLILDPADLNTTATLRVLAGPYAGEVYSLLSKQRDPLGFGWECRGRVTSAPEIDPPGDGSVLDFSDPANSGLLALFLDDMASPLPSGEPGALIFSDPVNSGHLSYMLEAA